MVLSYHYCPVKRTTPSLKSSIGAGCRPISFGADLNFSCQKPSTFPGLTTPGRAHVSAQPAQRRIRCVDVETCRVKGSAAPLPQLPSAARPQQSSRSWLGPAADCGYLGRTLLFLDEVHLAAHAGGDEFGKGHDVLA